MQRATQVPRLPGLYVLLLLCGGAWSELSPVRFWLLLVAFLCAGFLWWGLHAWQERHRVRRHVSFLRALRAFAGRLQVGSLGGTGFFRDGALEITGRWDAVPIRLQVRQHPPTIRYEVWTHDSDVDFEVERGRRRSRGWEQVPEPARGLVGELLDEQRFEWLMASPAGLVGSRRLDAAGVHPDALEASFARLAKLSERCRAVRPRARSVSARSRRGGARCPYCHADLDDGSTLRACSSCGTSHHAGCFSAGGCTVLGCAGRWRGQPLAQRRE